MHGYTNRRPTFVKYRLIASETRSHYHVFQMYYAKSQDSISFPYSQDSISFPYKYVTTANRQHEVGLFLLSMLLHRQPVSPIKKPYDLVIFSKKKTLC